MAKKKSKKLTENAELFKKINAQKAKSDKARREPLVLGKCQVLVTYVRFGKDKFKNDSYEWEFKILSGPNEGRTAYKSMSLARVDKEGDKDETKRLTYAAMDRAVTDLYKIGINELDRDAIESMDGAVLEVELWRHKEAPETGYTQTYFKSLISLPEEEEEEEEEVVEEKPKTKAKADKKPTQEELADSLEEGMSADDEEPAADDDDEDEGEYEDDDYEDDDDEE